ncbi:MAG: hypothetical protein GIW98_02635 [Candidatus Eremiobacteraeota bacterium]|nr:hypothetical protein [Candidatus Eremiobacteraeota bacterium]
MNVSTLLRQFRELHLHAKVVSLSIALSLVVAAVIAARLTHDSRVQLFATALHPEQLAEVQERLASWNAVFAPTIDNVLVSAKQRNELLLRLSLSGVPHAHIDGSNETLAKIGALTPQSVLEAQSRDGLSGDLELGLRGIAGVEDARVIIAPAKPGYYADEQSHDASASVRLTLHPGAKLSQDAVAGIRSFIAAGVPGLETSRVTIVDDRGVALGDSKSGESDANDLQNSLQSALDGAFGGGSSIVRVRMEFDPRAQHVREVRRAVTAGAAIGTNRSAEVYSSLNKHYSKQMISDDRGSDVREEQTHLASGRLSRLSIAIFVDAGRGLDLFKIRSLAAAAAGLDQHRGDTLTVQAVPFSRSLIARKDAWWLAYGVIVPAVPIVLLGIILVFSLRLFVKPASTLVRAFVTRSTVARTQRAVSGFAPTAVRGALLHEPPHTAAAVISALPAATAAAVLDMYPADERSAIIRRMARPASPLLGDCETIIANA